MAIRRLMTAALLGAALLAFGGCVSAVSSVVTAPFKIAGQAADWATTSQDEADRNRGRKLRKAEAKAYRACKAYDDAAARAQCVREYMDSKL